MNADLKHLDFIDALRGWAAFGVILVHSQQIVLAPSFLVPLVGAGAHGVQLFFIISAFTLFYSLSTRNDRHPFKNFMVRRFFRIAPLFYMVAIVSLLVGNTKLQYWAPNGVSDFGVFLTFIFFNGWHPEFQNSLVSGGWTIAVEMNFYVLVPLLFISIQRVWVAVASIPLVYGLGSAISRWLSSFYRANYSQEQMYLVDNWQWMNFPASLYVFFFGIVAFFIWREWAPLFKKLKPNVWSIILYTLVVLLIIVFYWKPNLQLVVFLFTCIFLAASASDSILIHGRFIRFLGKISFSMYLLHFFILRIINHWIGSSFPWFFTFALLLALTVIVSYVSYRVIERPFQQLGKYIINRWLEKQA